jgi:lysozyme|nr:MAG TPA: lysozyme [Caudoviricetes sp.]
MGKARLVAAALSLSAAGLLGLTSYEGYRETAYLPTPNDVPTVGFGSTDGVKLGDRVTVPEALSRLRNDVEKAESALVQCVHVPLNQGEYDAFTSLAFNIGAKAFCGSTLVKRLNAGDYAGACSEIRRWVYQGGKKLPGLVKRRESEYLTCIGESKNE